jgi:hypothetical protein
VGSEVDPRLDRSRKGVPFPSRYDLDQLDSSVVVVKTCYYLLPTAMDVRLP